MRVSLAVAGLALAATLSLADDKPGTVVEWAGLKAAAPAAWKEETPSSKMRLAQFKVPKAEGDSADAEIAVFVSPGGGGVDANLKRQLAVFEPAKGKDKVEDKTEKVKVGPYEATYQDLKGTLLKKAAPFDPNSKVTPLAGYRQLYVIFETNDKSVASLWLRGPEKTVEANKKAFDQWVKNFK